MPEEEKALLLLPQGRLQQQQITQDTIRRKNAGTAVWGVGGLSK